MSQTYTIGPFGERNETHVPIESLDALGQRNQFSLPEDLLTELRRFVMRNRIKCGAHPDQVCLRCLKAHAKWLLEKDNVEERKKEVFLSLFQTETGHNGYYQDKHIVREIL